MKLKSVDGRQAAEDKTIGGRKLAIRLFDVNAGDALLYEALEPVQAAEIERLGIVPRDSETPLQAWLRSTCEENGLTL